MRRRMTLTERGAVLVETAIVAPILITLTLGLAELGLIVRDNQTTVGASRAAARVVSSSGDTRLADYDALATLAAALDEVDPAAIERIVIFRPLADGSMPNGCLNSSKKDDCNHYDGLDLARPAADFFSAIKCESGSPDKEWCPLDRETGQVPGPDWIGVRIDIRHESFAFFLPDRTVSDTTIMRIEPRFVP